MVGCTALAAKKVFGGNTFRLTTSSCIGFARAFYGKTDVKPASNPQNHPTSALIQAALPKAASTNALLADATPAQGLAGAPRSGACISPARTSHKRSLNTRHAHAGRVRVRAWGRRIGRSVIFKHY